MDDVKYEYALGCHVYEFNVSVMSGRVDSNIYNIFLIVKK